MKDDFPYRLYLVVSEADCKDRSLYDVVKDAVRGGVDIVQLREKYDDEAHFLDKALRLNALLGPLGVPLIVNDSVPVAAAASVYGVHVGNKDQLPSVIKKEYPALKVGWSVEYDTQMDSPELDFVSYLGLSPVFSTPTKTDTVTEWGLQGIRSIRKKTLKPIVAIGNMQAANALEVMRAGADCIAVVSAIAGAADPARAAANIRNEIEKAI